MEEFFENDIEEALEREQVTLLEIEMEQLEKSETPKPAEAPERKKLKRELELEALARLEDSARTEDDFNNVVTWWNRLDANRERRERYHEIGRSDVPLEWGMSADEIIIPSPTQHNFRKQITRGEFLDVIYNCPFEMHELVTDSDISDAIFELKDVQKELLYQIAIRGYSCQFIASFRNLTDRNIRKVRDTMLKKIRKALCLVLHERINNNVPLTKMERAFYDTYHPLITDKKKRNPKNNSDTI
jgi:hypothetical protein